jgi:hypothetical protein
LYMNLSDALDKYFKSIGSKIRDVVRGEIGESSTCGVKIGYYSAANLTTKR